MKIECNSEYSTKPNEYFEVGGLISELQFCQSLLTSNISRTKPNLKVALSSDMLPWFGAYLD
jgi:hypothetical protein